jgi:hypothetical protein
LNKEEVIGGSLLFIFGAATVYFSLQMPIGTFRAAGSGLFPLGLGVLLMGLSAILLIKSCVQPRPLKKQTPSGAARSNQQLVLFIGAIALAALLLKQLGYPFMAFLLLLSLLRILGVKRWAFTLALSLLTATGVYALFVLWLQIPLPKGWIGL